MSQPRISKSCNKVWDVVLTYFPTSILFSIMVFKAENFMYWKI